MSISELKMKKNPLRLPVISTLIVLFTFSASLPALAQDNTSIDTLRQMGKTFSKIAEKSSPAIVGLKAEKTIADEEQSLRDWPFGDQFEDEFFDYFFRRRSPRQPSPQPKFRQLAQGSGFIISSDGYILTNNHLVGKAEKIMVKLTDGREFEAKLIGTDPESDVAVVKIDANDLAFLELADSDTIEVGEWVLAIGNPFGLSHTVTAGIVSATGRSGVGIATYEDYIQTDAAINPGNSGGPLINLDGKVIGINTAIISQSGGNMGIGFAIPINMAKSIYDQLVESGTVDRGFLGVSIQDLTPELAASFGLKDIKGVLIPEIIEGSAAEKAGLKQGDIIVELDGQPVEKAGALQNRIAMLKPGTNVQLVVLRNENRKTITVELGKRPTQTQLAGTPPEVMEQLGFSVQNLTEDIAKRFSYEVLEGVVVNSVSPGSLAELADIRPGTLIMEVNRKPVKNTEEFSKAIEEATKEGTVLLLVRDNRNTRFVVLKLPEK